MITYLKYLKPDRKNVESFSTTKQTDNENIYLHKMIQNFNDNVSLPLCFFSQNKSSTIFKLNEIATFDIRIIFRNNG